MFFAVSLLDQHEADLKKELARLEEQKKALDHGASETPVASTSKAGSGSAENQQSTSQALSSGHFKLLAALIIACSDDASSKLIIT